MELLRYIDRFGIGILGRLPGAGELRRMAMMDNTVRAYYGRERSGNWAEWATMHKEGAYLLEIGAKLTNDE